MWFARMAVRVCALLLIAAVTTAAALTIGVKDRNEISKLNDKVARFDGYRVYRVVPRNIEQVAKLREMQDTIEGLDFWKTSSKPNMPFDVMVPPHIMLNFEDSLNGLNLKWELFIGDVQKLVERKGVTGRSGSFSWSNYHRLNKIYAWMDELARKYPKIVTVVVGGTTYEGRKIKGVKVSYKEGNPGVFIEGGIHAREWISPATATYILNQVLTNEEPRLRNITEGYDWWFFPVLNPDGYEYTHRSNRLWRKTRSQHGLCYGTDPNRNWGFHWMDGGSSSRPCSEIYAGSKPFSEIETRSMSEYITSIADKLDVFISFHSYSQLLLLPYGFQSSDKYVSNHDVLMDIGEKAKEALSRQYGTKYKVGNIVDTIYVASGGSMDWVRGTFNTTITYTYELRDSGRHGFLLPPEQIIPTGQETLDSVVTILEESRPYINAKKSN